MLHDRLATRKNVLNEYNSFTHYWIGTLLASKLLGYSRKRRKRPHVGLTCVGLRQNS